ncbi:hypothetical protein [Tetragenococcus halophilus]|uniref:hypothetical protein n=1 Tax=Tetragenococcus halophilus TaxID=51669 RepID=UPI00240332B6|nr:hypothetical protein [Tetragenococcus halophilus]GLL52333.1 hypothetical protein YA5_023120 [Tetragenococcus halophilus]
MQSYQENFFQNYSLIFDRSNYPNFKKSNRGYIPEDDAPCVCLSGKIFANCCKDGIEDAIKIRKIKPEEAKKNIENHYNKQTKNLLSFKTEKKSIGKKNISYCSAQEVFGGCDSKQRIRYSHTLSKGSTLDRLSNGGRLVRFNDHALIKNINLSNINDYFEDVADNRASVTVSFCKKHDEELFFHIEKDGNNTFKNDIIQNLEYSLKAITFDIYYKIMNIKYLSNLIKHNKYVANNPDGSLSSFFEDYNLFVSGLFKLYPLMKKLLVDLKKKNNNSQLITQVFKLPVDRINFSLSEVIEINGIPCFINVVNNQNPFIIISYFPQNGKHIDYLKNIKMDFDHSGLICWRTSFYALWPLTKLLLNNSINIYFNKTEFDKLPDEVKFFLVRIHREGTKNISSHELYYFGIIINDFLYNISEQIC